MWRRPGHATILLVALGLGLGTFMLLSGDEPGGSRDPGSEGPTTSDASVLGVVITADDAATLPTAGPASPATFEPAAPNTTQDASPANTAPPAPVTTSTTPGPSLIEPTVIENTTTTTSPPTTIDLSTTTTTEPTTTTEAPAG